MPIINDGQPGFTAGDIPIYANGIPLQPGPAEPVLAPTTPINTGSIYIDINGWHNWTVTTTDSYEYEADWDTLNDIERPDSLEEQDEPFY